VLTEVGCGQMCTLQSNAKAVSEAANVLISQI